MRGCENDYFKVLGQLFQNLYGKGTDAYSSIYDIPGWENDGQNHIRRQIGRFVAVDQCLVQVKYNRFFGLAQFREIHLLLLDLVGVYGHQHPRKAYCLHGLYKLLSDKLVRVDIIVNIGECFQYRVNIILVLSLDLLPWSRFAGGWLEGICFQKLLDKWG